MKILIYTEYFFPIPGGVQTIVFELARGLAEWGMRHPGGETLRTDGSDPHAQTDSRRRVMAVPPGSMSQCLAIASVTPRLRRNPSRRTSVLAPADGASTREARGYRTPRISRRVPKRFIVFRACPSSMSGTLHGQALWPMSRVQPICGWHVEQPLLAGHDACAPMVKQSSGRKHHTNELAQRDP